MNQEGDTELVMVLRWFVAAAAASMLMFPGAMAAEADGRVPEGLDALPDAGGLVQDLLPPSDPAQVPAHLVGLLDSDEPAQEEPAPQPKEPEAGFADRIRDAFSDQTMTYSLVSAAAVALSLGGFALVSRYVTPKEALKNPQRAMLYGFIRATPGAHLKQLSDEFGMKTSSILWHIRKLESADLVKSDRVNGYRVFYPCEGGIEIRRVSRAMAALQNENALRVYDHLSRHPGVTARHVSERLSLHGGTARWHLRKLREHGLLDELIQEDGSRFYPTPLGNRALESREGRPVDAPRPLGRPMPSE